jgi:hypothetical protein
LDGGDGIDGASGFDHFADVALLDDLGEILSHRFAIQTEGGKQANGDNCANHYEPLFREFQGDSPLGFRWFEGRKGLILPQALAGMNTKLSGGLREPMFLRVYNGEQFTG